ncbi:MAG: type II secretion system F family protein [Sneathiella sp.]
MKQEKKNIGHIIIEGGWLNWLYAVCACSIVCLGFVFPSYISVIWFLLILLSATWTALWVVRYLNRRRINQISEQLPETIDIIIRGARLGKSVSQNLAIVGEEMPAPIGIAFQKLADQLNVGMDLEGSFATIRDISKIKEMQFLSTTLALQKKFGGEYAEILENLNRLIRDRRAHALKTKALTAEARLSAKIISAVTVILIGFLAVTNDTQIAFLLNDHAGQHLLLYCLVSNAIGFIAVSLLLKGTR